MKSLGVVALALLCIALFAFAVKNVLTTARDWEFAQDTARLFTAIEVERIVRDSLAAENARDSVESALLLDAANQSRRRGEGYKRVADSLLAALDASVTAPESLVVVLAAAEGYRDALGQSQSEVSALRSVVATRDLQLSRLKVSEALGWKNVDSLTALTRRAPRGCRVPLVGLRCPVPVLGLGMTVDGPKWFVGLGVPLGG